jgi:hypothetical protein
MTKPVGPNNGGALVPTPATVPAPMLDAMDRYARSGAAGLFGDLLKYSGKVGEWTSGAQGLEMPATPSWWRSCPRCWSGT